jgi:lipopolysaccharide/colanic/teichoic acid biosynthesis glycosyltransferase
LIGWFEHGSVIGLLRSLGQAETSDAAAALAATVRRELAHCLEGRASAGCSIRLEVYTPHHEHIPSVLVPEDDPRRHTRKLLRRGAKRALDVAGSFGLLVVLAPVFAAIAAAVKLTSRGPVFFRQQRIGEAGRPFTMLKFRTMQVDADPAIHQQYVTAFIKSSAEGAPAESGVFKIVNDPRVTAIGHFLRRASLDELPQFWNVLKGEMSLVGPRPPLPYEVATYKRWHRRRVLEARPGVTGLWQVTGRSRTTFEEMVRLDLRRPCFRERAPGPARFRSPE